VGDVKLEFIGPGGDKDTLSAKSADEVLDDALVRRKRIRSIRVRGSNYDVKPPRTARLLIDTRWVTPVHLSAEADHDSCSVLKSELDSLLVANRTSYAFLYPSTRMLFGVILVIALVVGVAISETFSEMKLSLLEAGALSGLLSGGAAIGLIQVRHILFPQLVIDIGRSGELARRSASRQQLLFISVGLALVVGIAATLIVDWFRQ
jgi:hypothetical protein